ncbi:MAG: hypothetical protein ACLQVK_00045 [Acidimicrobiales bacterium]
MTTCPPPYRPFRGAPPPHFVDRADAESIDGAGIVATSLAAYRAGPGDPRFHQLVTSTPALGKTAQARAVARQVSAQLGWVVTFHRCRPKERAMRDVANQTVTGMARLWAPEAPPPVVRAANQAEAGQEAGAPTWPRTRPGHPAGQGLAPGPQLRRLVPTGREPSWTELREFFALAGSFARAISRGLLLVLDDADRLSGAEVECAGHLARSLSRDGLPVAFLLTGGPQLGQRFARTGNFAGSVWPTRLGRFDDSEAREALVVPAADRDVEFEEGALERLCAAADGRPLEVQRLGLAAWSSSARSGKIGLAAAEEAVGLVAPETTAMAS